MRFKFRNNETKKVNDTKRKFFYALFPVWIGSEFRWLENVTVEYKCVEYLDMFGYKSLIWVKSSFID